MASGGNLRRAVSDALEGAGFARAGRMHLAPLLGGFRFVVDTGPLGRRSDIAPWVGLRHDGVHRLLTELLELPADDYVATVGANVGYVVGGGYRVWRDGGQLNEVLAAIHEGRDVLAQFARIDLLAGAWSIRGTDAPGYCYSLVVTEALAGEWAAARQWLAEAERIDCRFDDELCQQFKRFERNALLRFAELAAA